jgi:hypothetical protein
MLAPLLTSVVQEFFGSSFSGAPGQGPSSTSISRTHLKTNTVVGGASGLRVKLSPFLLQLLVRMLLDIHVLWPEQDP